MSSFGVSSPSPTRTKRNEVAANLFAAIDDPALLNNFDEAPPPATSIMDLDATDRSSSATHVARFTSPSTTNPKSSDNTLALSTTATTAATSSNTFAQNSNRSRTPSCNKREEERNFDNWVIVYGFQRDDANLILRQFSQYGTIRRKFGLGNASWICLKYDTELQMRKALCQNGNLYMNSNNNLLAVLEVDQKFATMLGIDHVILSDGSKDVLHLPTQQSLDQLHGGGEPPKKGHTATTHDSLNETESETLETTTAKDDDPAALLKTPVKNHGLAERVLAWYFDWKLE